MIIKRILSKLDAASSPVAEAMLRNGQAKATIIGFKKGMILKEHKSNLPATLLVMEGSVTYKEAKRSVSMDRFDDLEIPVGEIHSVEALEDSVCLLIQG